MGTMQAIIIRDLAQHGKGTASKVAERIGLHEPSVSRRFTDLVRLGLVELTGESGRSSTDSPAGVYRLTQAGRDWPSGTETAPVARGPVTAGPTAVSDIVREMSNDVGQTSLFDASPHDGWSTQWGKVKP